MPKGTERRSAQRLGSRRFRRRASGEEARADRRSIAAFFQQPLGCLQVPRPALPGTSALEAVSHLRPVPVQPAPGGAVIMPLGRGPGASRVPACEAGPRAPHPIPLSERLMTAPFDGPDGLYIVLLGIYVKRLFQNPSPGGARSCAPRRATAPLSWAVILRGSPQTRLAPQDDGLRVRCMAPPRDDTTARSAAA